MIIFSHPQTTEVFLRLLRYNTT